MLLTNFSGRLSALCNLFKCCNLSLLLLCIFFRLEEKEVGDCARVAMVPNIPELKINNQVCSNTFVLYLHRTYFTLCLWFALKNLSFFVTCGFLENKFTFIFFSNSPDKTLELLRLF